MINAILADEKTANLNKFLDSPDKYNNINQLQNRVLPGFCPQTLKSINVYRHTINHHR